MIPYQSFSPYSVIALPKANSNMLAGKYGKLPDHFCIILSLSLIKIVAPI